MTNNLKAEMARAEVTQVDIAELLGTSPNTVVNKMAGRTSFNIKEAHAIRDKFFPDKTIDYLFGAPARDEPC